MQSSYRSMLQRHRCWIFCSRSPNRLTCGTWIRSHTGMAPNPMPLTTHYSTCSGFFFFFSYQGCPLRIWGLQRLPFLFLNSNILFPSPIPIFSSILSICTCFASQAFKWHSVPHMRERDIKEKASEWWWCQLSIYYWEMVEDYLMIASYIGMMQFSKAWKRETMITAIMKLDV